MVEQDANHLAAEQAREFDPGLPWYPWLRDSIEILRRRASRRHSAEVCRSKALDLGVFLVWQAGAVFVT